ITVIATLLMSSDSETEAPLHFDSTARDGTKAMVETLRSHGTEVTTTEDKEEARTAAAHADTTLLIPTGAAALSAGDVNRFGSASTTMSAPWAARMPLRSRTARCRARERPER